MSSTTAFPNNKYAIHSIPHHDNPLLKRNYSATRMRTTFYTVHKRDREELEFPLRDKPRDDAPILGVTWLKYHNPSLMDCITHHFLFHIALPQIHNKACRGAEQGGHLWFEVRETWLMEKSSTLRSKLQWHTCWTSIVIGMSFRYLLWCKATPPTTHLFRYQKPQLEMSVLGESNSNHVSI